MTNDPQNGRGHVTWSSLNFKVPNHISGIAEAIIVIFLTQVGYIKCYHKDDISPLNGHGYGHVTIFKLTGILKPLANKKKEKNLTTNLTKKWTLNSTN